MNSLHFQPRVGRLSLPCKERQEKQSLVESKTHYSHSARHCPNSPKDMPMHLTHKDKHQALHFTDDKSEGQRCEGGSFDRLADQQAEDGDLSLGRHTSIYEPGHQPSCLQAASWSSLTSLLLPHQAWHNVSLIGVPGWLHTSHLINVNSYRLVLSFHPPCLPSPWRWLRQIHVQTLTPPEGWGDGLCLWAAPSDLDPVPACFVPISY